MAWANCARIRQVTVGLLLLSSTGCSLINERPPPSSPAERTSRVAAKCSDYQFPLADAISVVASITWIVYANEKIADNEPKPDRYETNPFGQAQYVPASSGDPSNVTNFKWLRASGYGALALFGVSAIYGSVIEMQCQALKQELAAKNNHQPLVVSSKHPAFPASVLGFSFESR